MQANHFDLETQRQAFRDSQRLFDVANILRTAKSVTELTSLWDAYCEDTRGDVRVALQDVYSEMLGKLGALQG